MKFRRRLEPRVGVDLVPMIDVLFQLILFLLVTTTFALLPGINLSLPESTTASNERTNGITISVTASGELYLNENAVGPGSLEAALESLPVDGDRAAVPVSLEADEVVPNGTIVRIFDSLRRTGYTGVTLRTRGQ
jgi:biopolymer transport protein ExbD